MNVAAATSARLVHKRNKRERVWERNNVVPLFEAILV
jgi:hypothetical protein